MKANNPVLSFYLFSFIVSQFAHPLLLNLNICKTQRPQLLSYRIWDIIHS
jgi:hypothetical protein